MRPVTTAEATRRFQTAKSGIRADQREYARNVSTLKQSSYPCLIARVNKSALQKPCTILVGDSRVDKNNASTEAFVGIQIARPRGRDNRCHDGPDMGFEVKHAVVENRQETGAVR